MSKLKGPEAAGIIAIGLAAGIALQGQFIVWASNVAADSFAGFTGFSFRQGVILGIFHTILTTKASTNIKKARQ